MESRADSDQKLADLNYTILKDGYTGLAGQG